MYYAGHISSIASLFFQKDEIVPLLNYTIERLVRGLSSTNKAARLGFYVALVQILRVSKENINPTSIVNLVKSEYDSTLGNQVTTYTHIVYRPMKFLSLRP